MKQLNLSSERRSDFISDFENQIARYTDILSEIFDEIRYAEHIVPHKGKEVIPGMEYEDYIDIKKKNLKGLTYDQILLFLKNTTPPNGRIKKFKNFLSSKDIYFESGLWTCIIKTYKFLYDIALVNYNNG